MRLEEFGLVDYRKENLMISSSQAGTGARLYGVARYSYAIGISATFH